MRHKILWFSWPIFFGVRPPKTPSWSRVSFFVVTSRRWSRGQIRVSSAILIFRIGERGIPNPLFTFISLHLSRVFGLIFARMSVVDKLDAARHSITGSHVAKVVCKASSREVMGPKRKHLDCKFAHWKFFSKVSKFLFGEVNDPLDDLFCSTDLTSCTHNDNVSIPNLADLIFERCTNSSWVVVFKAECTFHHLMSYGNEVSLSFSLLDISLVSVFQGL